MWPLTTAFARPAQSESSMNVAAIANRCAQIASQDATHVLLTEVDYSGREESRERPDHGSRIRDLTHSPMRMPRTLFRAMPAPPSCDVRRPAGFHCTPCANSDYVFGPFARLRKHRFEWPSRKNRLKTSVSAGEVGRWAVDQVRRNGAVWKWTAGPHALFSSTHFYFEFGGRAVCRTRVGEKSSPGSLAADTGLRPPGKSLAHHACECATACSERLAASSMHHRVSTDRMMACMSCFNLVNKVASPIAATHSLKPATCREDAEDYRHPGG